MKSEMKSEMNLMKSEMKNEKKMTMRIEIKTMSIEIGCSMGAKSSGVTEMSSGAAEESERIP